jgi:hypothetical protein
MLSGRAIAWRVDVRGPVVGVPLGHGDEVAVFVGGWAGRWVERAHVGLPGALGFGEGVVDVENRVLGAVRAELFSVLALYDWERVDDVSQGVTRPRNVYDQARCHSLSPVGRSG